MMNIDTVMKIAKFLNSDLLWLYFALIILSFYLLIALFTWNIKRPLNFIGIPTTIVGVLLILIYFLIDIIPLPLSDALIEVIISGIKPVLNIGIICLIMGIVMIVLYKITTKNKDVENASNQKKIEKSEKDETAPVIDEKKKSHETVEDNTKEDSIDS